MAQLPQDLRRVVLQLTDEASRPHLLRLQLPASFPVAAPIAALDLPEPFKFSWGQGHNSLASLVSSARQVRSRFKFHQQKTSWCRASQHVLKLSIAH